MPEMFAKSGPPRDTCSIMLQVCVVRGPESALPERRSLSVRRTVRRSPKQPPLREGADYGTPREAVASMEIQQDLPREALAAMEIQQNLPREAVATMEIQQDLSI